LEPENPEVPFSEFSRSREFLEDTLSDKDLKADPPGHKSGYAALIGRPNVGKSTLLNALTGEKLSIVSPKAQTTRHRVLALVSEPDFQVLSRIYNRNQDPLVCLSEICMSCRVAVMVMDPAVLLNSLNIVRVFLLHT
jgi:hypothetical protein